MVHHSAPAGPAADAALRGRERPSVRLDRSRPFGIPVSMGKRNNGGRIRTPLFTKCGTETMRGQS